MIAMDTLEEAIQTTLEMKPEPHIPSPRPAPSRYDRLVLTGFMGSGKTSVGSLLAKKLGWQFLDLDTEVERREGRTVPQIFAESGEPHFRHLESAALASVLGHKRLVLALGGGAAEDLGNRLLLEQTPRTAVVYLAAPIEVLLERCRLQAVTPGATGRPLLADRNSATARFGLRRKLYERMASHSVETARLDLEEAAEAVLAGLQSGR